MKQRWGSTVVMVTVLATCGMAMGQQASQPDRDFVAKVSQGGMYEVEAGKVAATRGTIPAVRNFGVLEAHDHEGVGANLKRVANASGVTFATTLNAGVCSQAREAEGRPERAIRRLLLGRHEANSQ